MRRKSYSKKPKSARHFSRAKFYRELCKDRCQHPECDSGMDVEVHHIIPKRRKGPCEYWNFITLCRKCHRHNNLHRNWEDHITELFTWKSWFELGEFGFVLDENDPEYSENMRFLLKI